MNTLDALDHALRAYLQTAFNIDTALAHSIEIVLNVDEAKPEFGDINSNAAMVLAKSLKRNPRDIAQAIMQGFSHHDIERIELAGPGFLNFFLTSTALTRCATELFTQKSDFFKLALDDPKHRYNIEFVSANPTGPLHLGHGRGGIIGDVLANVLKFLGHAVTKEFYINDAGSQIQKLGRSLKIRCQQECGLDVAMFEEGYHGTYLIALAQECIKEYGNVVLEQSDSFFEEYAKEKLLKNLQTTLAHYGITFDVWFSEKQLHNDGSIKRTLDLLGQHGYLFEQDGAMWFKSTAFGDDKDRVMRKSSGELTYVAADAAYLNNKVHRGFDHLVMVLGHDHHSYAVRLQGLLQALGLANSTKLDVILYQLVKIKEGGQQVRMSKRAGTMVNLDDVIQEVGTDVARFFYLNRKADAQLDFDLDLALKKTEENPVYYVQYAYVRTLSLLNKAQEEALLRDLVPIDIALLNQDDAFLIKKIAALKAMLVTIGKNHQTHLLTYYVIELAHVFHKYYSKNRVIDLSNPAQSRSRLIIITMLKDTFETVLTLLGISRPQKM
jgi:arginyl-tRNA synthetase